MAGQLPQLRREIALLRQTPITFLQFYYNKNLINENPDNMTSARLMEVLRTKITNLKQECYTANEQYELVLGLPFSQRNEELNQINWTKIITQFKRESQSILELLGTTVMGFALAQRDRVEHGALFNDEEIVFMTRWNQIRERSREIIIKILNTKEILAHIVGKPTNDLSSNELLEEIIGHLKFTNDRYDHIIRNMIPLIHLRMIHDNEEKLLQIILYIQQLEPRAEKTDQLSRDIAQLELSGNDTRNWMLEVIQTHNPMALIGIDITNIEEILLITQNIIKELEKRPPQNQDQTIQNLQRDVILWRNLALYLSGLKANCTTHLALPYWN